MVSHTNHCSLCDVFFCAWLSSINCSAQWGKVVEFTGLDHPTQEMSRML
jgi:hypothetical protein